jgi:2-polyprenyl-6-hydroxyphenyl methylase/3-demethylubiquinone-9 3-methyltransferase
MREVVPEASWPESWVYSYKYDREEVFGTPSNWGYALAYHNRRQETLKLVTEAIKPGATVLDVAAAQGNFTLALAELGYRVTWNDLRADLAGYVQKKYERGEVAYVAGNAFELNFADGFDCVLFCEVIEHVAHPDEFMANIARLVKPGGIAVMTTPNGRYFRNTLPRFSDCADPSVFETTQFKPDSDGHIFLLWPDEIRRFAKRSRLVIERQLFFSTPLTNGLMKTDHLLRFMPHSWVWMIERAAQRLPAAAQECLMVQTAARFRKVDESCEARTTIS